MGSLMAGWDSLILDSKAVSTLRNRSCTKEEIENFWQLHKKCEKEEEDGQRHEEEHNSSTPKLESHVLGFTEAKKTDDWWTRSNWAFLNQPSQEEGNTVKSLNEYASQHNITELPATTKKFVHAH